VSNRKKSAPFRRKLAPDATPHQIAALLQGKAGAVVLEYRHDDGCPAIGSGRGCVCKPDVYIVALEGLAEVQP